MYLVVDPGESTGLGTFKSWPRRQAPEVVGTTRTCRHEDRRWLLVLDDLFAQGKYDSVVIESFHLFAHKAQAQIGSEFITIEIIGAIKYIALRHHLTVYTLMPAQKKPFESLQLLNHLYGPTTIQMCNSEHERDVLRLAMAFHMRVLKDLKRKETANAYIA